MNAKCLNFCQSIGNWLSPLRSSARSDRLTNNLSHSNSFNNRLNAITIRCISSKPKSSVVYQKEIRKSVTKCLINSFGLQLEDVETIFKNYPDFNHLTPNDLQNKISLLELKQLCCAEVATKRSWIFLTDKQTLSYGIQILDDFKQLDRIRDGKTYIFALFLINKNRFKVISKRIGRKNSKFLSDFDERLDFFCHNLEINCQMFCSVVNQNIYLLIKDMNHIKRVIQLLKDNGLSKEELIKDHWIFNHNIQVMEKRIEECKSNQRPVRTWSLRCPDRIWYPLVNRWKQNVDALGEENNTRGLLIKLLKCRDVDINQMVDKNSRLLTIAPKKLDQMIKFLYESGYTAKDIIRMPRVFNHSLERAKRRLIDQNYSVVRPDLDIILVTEKEYIELTQLAENIQHFQTIVSKD